MTDRTMTDSDTGPETGHAPERRADWRWLAVLGVLMTLGGIVALLNPFAASLTATAIAGATLFVAGVMQLWMAFRDCHGVTGRLSAAGLGLLLVLFSLTVLANPLAGIVSLTLFAGAAFFALGVMRIWMAMKLSDRTGWGWMVAAGSVSIALGALTLLAAPQALGLLGVFLGVDLLFSGASAMGVAMVGRTA